MAGTRQPLAVLEAKGAKHLTKAEKAAREDSEVKAETPKFVRPPKWLPEAFHKEFNEISRQLLDLKIFCKLDRDTLSRYLIAQNLYLQTTQRVNVALRGGDVKEAAAWTTMQNTYATQCKQFSNDLGMTISSRCKLVIPKAPEDDGDAEAEGAILRIFGA